MAEMVYKTVDVVSKALLALKTTRAPLADAKTFEKFNLSEQKKKISRFYKFLHFTDKEMNKIYIVKYYRRG